MKLVLNLTIRRKWLDMFTAGPKFEEYRPIDNRQVLRLVRMATDGVLPDGALVVLRAGYRMDSPAALALLGGVSARTFAKHPEWGEPEEPHFVLQILPLERLPYREIKEKLSRMGVSR